MILAVETSCDETAVALLRPLSKSAPRPVVLIEQLASQTALHALYGGVVPELAAREHLKALPLLVDSVLRTANCSFSDLTGVAVTSGPGLKGALLIGFVYAKAIAFSRGIPFLGVNHIEGHLLSPMLDHAALNFPYLGLVVSGGHTELHLVRGLGDYSVLARTRDDAAGEAFDKSATLIGIPYPGGAELAKLADSYQGAALTLPRVMQGEADFSFSGLKTAFSLLVKRTPWNEDALQRAALASALQIAVVGALVSKVSAAVKATGIRSVGLSGGVAANGCLRRMLPQVCDLFAAEPRHCTDNAAMIGYVGALRLARGEQGVWSDSPRARWMVEELR